MSPPASPSVPATLEGWPVAWLTEAPQRCVRPDEFREALIESRFNRLGTALLKTPITLGGSANARYRSAPLPADGTARALVRSLCGPTHFRWAAEHLVLIDRDCFIAVDTGVLLLEDGSIIGESLFPSTGEKTIARQVGGDLDARNISRALKKAPLLEGAAWAPLLCRWSPTYFHAVTESLVQDTVFACAGLSSLISHPVPVAVPSGAQQIVLSCASSRKERSEWPLVRVPRVVFSTAFYKHAALGGSFRQFVERARAQVVDAAQGGERVYVARSAARARRMTNEAELIAHLQEMGFQIFRGDGLSLQDQVRAFRDASLIVGPHGSGLTNVAFARPDATLCELRPLNTCGQSPMQVEEYQQLCAVMGFSYCAHVSVNEVDTEEWTANIPEIIALLEAIA